jgi:molybdopterin converting factor subunit 1
MTDPRTVTVLFFAHLVRDGETSRDVTFDPGTTAGDLVAAISRTHEGLASMRGRVAIAVNERYVSEAHVLAPGDVVALIPPVSGG